MSASQNNPTNSASTFSLMSRFGKHLTAGGIALGLCLFLAAANSQAQSNFYWAGSASANWADANQWNTTNSSGVFTNGIDWPGDTSNPNDENPQQDYAWFTNSGTFNVSVGSPIPSSYFYIGSNQFDNASGTVMNVSINIGSGIDFRTHAGDGFVVAQAAGSTSIVSVTTSGGTLDTGFSSTSLYIGKNGYGVLYCTNTQAISIAGGNWSLGDGTNSQGLLIVSGSHTFVDMGTTSGGHLNVGNNASYGNTVILESNAVMSVPNLRMGSSAAGGSSNNLMIVQNGALLFIAGGHAVVGNRAGDTAGTNAPACNNTLIFQNGGYGDSSNHTFQIGWADNDVPTTPPSTGNVCIISSPQDSFTNISTCLVRSNNSLYVYGGTFGGGYTNVFGGGTTNQGMLTAWGTLMGSVIGWTGSVTIASNNVGALTISHDLVMQTGSVMQIALGSTFNSITLGSNCTLNGTLNFIDGGGFATVGDHTYTLFTGNFSTNVYSGTCPACTTNPVPWYANTNNLTIGGVPGYPSTTYTISLPDFHTVNLIVNGFATAYGPLRITSITRAPTANDITINWNTSGLNGQFNYVQVTSGSANGSYNTNNFVVIATNTIAGATASYTDTGGATNRPTRYYRIWSPQ
jgi:hypothetical protein